MTAARLQSADVVLRQQSQEAAVDMRRAGHIAALLFVHDPHARIRLRSLLQVDTRRIADETQGREPVIKGVVEEILLEMETSGDRVHECPAGLDHSVVVMGDHFAPARQRLLARQRRRLLQWIVAARER